MLNTLKDNSTNIPKDLEAVLFAGAKFFLWFYYFSANLFQRFIGDVFLNSLKIHIPLKIILFDDKKFTANIFFQSSSQR